MAVKINRAWKMPNKNTFDMKCVARFIYTYQKQGLFSIDPFANKNRIATVTNDLDPAMVCDFNMDAYEFLKTFNSESIDIVYFDPPYSSRQVSESYKKLGHSVNMETTQSSFWRKLKDEIQRVLKPGGICLSFGWNSNEIGKTRGFSINEILIIAHGGAHNDTICMAETKNKPKLNLFNYGQEDLSTMRDCG